MRHRDILRNTNIINIPVKHVKMSVQTKNTLCWSCLPFPTFVILFSFLFFLH